MALTAGAACGLAPLTSPRRVTRVWLVQWFLGSHESEKQVTPCQKSFLMDFSFCFSLWLPSPRVSFCSNTSPVFLEGSPLPPLFPLPTSGPHLRGEEMQPASPFTDRPMSLSRPQRLSGMGRCSSQAGPTQGIPSDYLKNDLRKDLPEHVRCVQLWCHV